MEIEEKEETKNTLENDLNTEITTENMDIEKKQNSFLESTFGKIINTGFDLALRTLLPDVIEDEVIGIKNTIFNDGLKEGIKNAVNSAIDMGKSAIGVVTGKFETVSQAYNAIKSGGILDSASGLIDNAVKAAKENGLINNTVANVIKKGKNAIKGSIKDSIEENFMEQVDGVEKVGKYIQNWNECLEQNDLEGMNREFNKIKKKLENLIPLESTLEEARAIENVQTLIKNKGNSLENITEDELKLAKII